jgi:protein O-GlcNAc transferase
MKEKIKLRIIHNMARSGSTLMCKCLGCMKGVVLLSELHPHAWKIFNPLKQSMEWFGLLTETDIADLKKKSNISYAQVIELIELRCRERGDILVLRDWAHLDFIGLPFVANPPYRPLLYAALAQSFDIIRISTTRDPAAQWQSLVQLPLMREPLQSGSFGLAQFLLGYRMYAELCVEIGFIRYEDFVRKPELAMRRLCEQLRIDFDSDFINNWPNYTTITGDISNPRGSSKIQMPPSRSVTSDSRKEFLANADYHRACELLGYNLLEK